MQRKCLPKSVLKRIIKSGRKKCWALGCKNKFWFKTIHKLEYKGPHKNPCVACGLGTDAIFRINPIIGEGKCEVISIPCACLPWRTTWKNSGGPVLQTSISQDTHL